MSSPDRSPNNTLLYSYWELNAQDVGGQYFHISQCSVHPRRSITDMNLNCAHMHACKHSKTVSYLLANRSL